MKCRSVPSFRFSRVVPGYGMSESDTERLRAVQIVTRVRRLMVGMPDTYRKRKRETSWPDNGLLRALAKIAYYASAAFFFGLLALFLIGLRFVLLVAPVRLGDAGAASRCRDADRLGLRGLLAFHLLQGNPIRRGWNVRVRDAVTSRAHRRPALWLS